MGVEKRTLENLVMEQLFQNIYKNKRVLVTGHTGFKGSWLLLWLKKLGAVVAGYSLPASEDLSHYNLLCPNGNWHFGDIRNESELSEFILDFQPEIIFHLAAQSLVIESYKNPSYTYQTNLIGSLNLFEACRNVKSVRALVNITTDKVYENKEKDIPYNESDVLGGNDPYSASKACMELLIHSYKMSFFNPEAYGISHNLLIASVRAGNVIGGGDWSENRLIPDAVKSIVEDHPLVIRNPHSIRPWQHVLDPLSGYLLLGQKLLEGKSEYATAWNFGPEDENGHEVIQILRIVEENWKKPKIEITENHHFHESKLLKLDCTKALTILKWKPVWDITQSVKKTINWYKNFYESKKINSESDLNDYILEARKNTVVWTQ